MIITVLLFLSNSLATLMVLALLMSVKSKFHLSAIMFYIGAIGGALLILILWLYIDIISQMNDDTGLEWLYVGIQLIIYFLILLFVNTANKIEQITRQSSLHITAILTLIIMLQGPIFVGYLLNVKDVDALFFGIILGLGICISISILLYFFYLFLNERLCKQDTKVVYILFAGGLINKTSDLILQIKDFWKVILGLLFEQKLGRTSLSLNAFLIYAWGRDTDNEIKAEVRAQYRYRWLPQFQPAIELYSGENYAGVGSALMGIQRFDGQKQVKWEVGLINGLNGENKDHTPCVAVECEF